MQSPTASRIGVYVEAGVSMAYESGVAAWTYDLDRWGRCGQGRDETAALDDLARDLAADASELVVVQRLHGDERAFDRDRIPATTAERQATRAILDATRAKTRALLAACPDTVLDFDDPARVLPQWARWRTARAMIWHIADTDCRYYLPSVGIPVRPRAADLRSELDECATHVRDAVATMPADLDSRSVRGSGAGEEWTTTKVLRRLAWHERSELRALDELARANAELLGLRLELPS